MDEPRELKHWRSPSHRQLIVDYGTVDKRPIVPIVDALSGETWYARVTSRGEITNKAFKGRRTIVDENGVKKKIQLKEAVYTQDQYDLIKWALDRMDKGHPCSKVYTALIKRGWEVKVGQTPLSSRKVERWRKIRDSMLKKGLIWP